ncbi:MAG: transglycosylase SLT domain-containing protein [Myxococcales bacterium]|nr:transglycosylase SLT domain-containing protein [Myxococcales bacterium]
MRALAPLSWMLCLLIAAAAGAAPLTEADFSPIPVGSDPAALRRHVALNQWKEALATVNGVSPEAHFVRGWLAAQLNDHARVVSELREVPAQLPLLADRARVLAAEALMGLGRDADAAVMAEPVAKDPGPVGRYARRMVARGLREAGKLDEARTVYQLSAATGLPDEVPIALLGLARLEADTGSPDKALALVKRIDLEYPAHWAGPKAREMADELIGKAPALKREWEARSLDDHLNRGERLADSGWYSTIISDLGPLSGQPMSAGQKCVHRYTLGYAQRRRRQFSDALTSLDEAVKACEQVNHEKAPWARHVAGKIHERLSKEDSAAAHYRAQIDRHAAHRLADDAGFFLVRHLIEDKKDLKGAERTVTDLAKRFPEGDMTPEAVFWVFVEAFKRKDYKRAERILALNKKLNPPEGFRHRDAGRVTYWQARLDDERKRAKAALAGYRMVLREAPLSWYAVLAYSRLVERDRKAARAYAADVLRTLKGRRGHEAAAAVWILEPPTGAKAQAFEQARLLARLGLPDPAWDALKAADVTDTDQGKWLAAVLLDRAGAHNLSHDLMRRQLWPFRWLAPRGDGAQQWHVAFPRPYESLVQAASKATGVHEHFIWGVMREESGFNPGIESHAAAVGLLQLILPTAKSMREKGEKPVTKARLQMPEVNIPLGARYLAHVQKYTRAQWALVPAGYNAGAGALSKWLKRDGHLPLDLFVELIPYEEARWYTKRVVSSWAVYRAVYGEGFRNPIPYVSQKTRP